MTRKTSDVFDNDSLTFFGSRAANTFADRYCRASRFPTERAEVKFFTIIKIKPGPVDILNRRKNKGCSVGKRSDRMILRRQQMAKVGCQGLEESFAGTMGILR